MTHLRLNFRLNVVPRLQLSKHRELVEAFAQREVEFQAMREQRDSLRAQLGEMQQLVNPLKDEIRVWRERLDKEVASHSKVQNVKRLVHATVTYLEGRGVVVPPIAQSSSPSGGDAEEGRQGVWYSFGRRRILLKWNRKGDREEVLVCVGGGWQELSEYIQRYGVMERQKQLAASHIDCESVVSAGPGQLLRMMQRAPSAGSSLTSLPPAGSPPSLDASPPLGKGRPLSALPLSRSHPRAYGHRAAPRILPGASGGIGRGGSPTTGAGTFGPSMARSPSRPVSAAPIRS
jgi:hypothetical protein